VLAAVAGLLRPEDGRIVLTGTVLSDAAARRFVPPERRHCGVVFQDARLFPHMSVETNLRYGARRAAGRGTPEGPGFEEVVALLGLGALLGRRPSRLSGGEKQRVALGRALLSRPRILLMDEPLASLDAPRRAEAMTLFERVRDTFGVPMLYVTHALDEVDRLADTLVLMAAGRVTASGTIEALTARTDLPLLAGRRDAGSVIAGRIEAHDAARGLTRVAFAGGAVTVPLRREPAGARIRLRVRARDIAIATTRPEGISINNILPARVQAMDAAGAHEVFLRLAIGPTVLLARITRESAGKLGLAPGVGAFALIKSVAFDHAGPA
jgi:molybdate transport system ATP-binding protein